MAAPDLVLLALLLEAMVVLVLLVELLQIVELAVMVELVDSGLMALSMLEAVLVGVTLVRQAAQAVAEILAAQIKMGYQALQIPAVAVAENAQ
jgi:hypothetical protein